MWTDVQIINMGLSRVGETQIRQIDPPRSSLERHCAVNFAQWQRSEITKRRWVFATRFDYPMTLTETLTGVDRPYVFDMPTEMLRPLRENRVTWQQEGRRIRSWYETLNVTAVFNVPTSQYDPLFVDVLAMRVVLDSVEYLTQSNTKKEDALVLYNTAVSEAGRMNAFVRGPTFVDDDSAYDFIVGAYADYPGQQSNRDG